jgi:hypothetical protein
MFSGVVLVDGRTECSTSSTDVRPSLKRLYHKKSFALAHSIISKRFLKHSVGFCSSFVEPEAKFDADSLLLKIRPFSWRKKIAGPLKHDVTETHVNSRTRPLSLPAVGTLIHKGYCSAHLVAEGRTTTVSRVIQIPRTFG